MLYKKDIIAIIKSLDLPEDGYWISAGAGLVLHGVRETTRDIDMGCTTAVFEKLMKREHVDLPPHGTERAMSIDDTVEVFENWAVDRVETASGLPVASLADIKVLKVRLGREKDLADIRLIDSFLGKTQ